MNSLYSHLAEVVGMLDPAAAWCVGSTTINSSSPCSGLVLGELLSSSWALLATLLLLIDDL